MEEQTVEKPTAVVLIGWFGILTSLILLLLYIDEIMLADDLDSRYDPFSPMVTLFLNVYYNLCSIIILISSIFFLKLRKWARNALELLSWIGIVDGIILLIVLLRKGFIKGIMMDSDTPYTFAGEVFLTGFFMIVFGILMAISIVIIIFLRTSKVRNAMIN